MRATLCGVFLFSLKNNNYGQSFSFFYLIMCIFAKFCNKLIAYYIFDVVKTISFLDERNYENPSIG